MRWLRIKPVCGMIILGWRVAGVLADFVTEPYRSILVASNNDPCCPVRTARAYARAWASEFVRL